MKPSDLSPTDLLKVMRGYMLSYSRGEPVTVPIGGPVSKYETKDSGRRQDYVTGARRDTEDNKGRFDLIPFEAELRWAQLLERGARKYGDHNWEKGMPVSRCFSSAKRHLSQALAGLDDEDHLAAVLFNVAAIITYRERIKRGLLPASLDDVPRLEPQKGPADPSLSPPASFSLADAGRRLGEDEDFGPVS